MVELILISIFGYLQLFHDEYCQRSFKICFELLCFPGVDVSRGLMSALRYYHDPVGVSITKCETEPVIMIDFVINNIMENE